MSDSLTTRKIPLRNRAGEVIAEAIVDQSDYERVMGAGRWSLNRRRGYVYRKATIEGRSREVKLHRFIMEAGPEDPMVDHINRDALDNTRANLRFVTNAQNQQNRGTDSRGSSRYRGVYWQKDIGRWRVRVTLNREVSYLGTFTDEDEAGRVAQEWRRKNMPYSEERLLSA